MNWSDKQTWKQCFTATFICLIGCSIGNMGTPYFFFAYSFLYITSLSLIIGFISCILFIILWKLIFQKESFKASLNCSLKMSIVSMLIMMLSENIIILSLIPPFSHKHSNFHVIVMLLAMFVGFLLSLPYNYYQLYKKGKLCH